MRRWVNIFVIMNFLSTISAIQAVNVLPEETALQHRWIKEKFQGDQIPFEFTYDGRSSRDLLKDWQIQRDSRQPDALHTEYTIQYADPKSGLVVRCVGAACRHFPTVEWTLYFKNTAAADSPIIENIHALDTVFAGDADKSFVLHYNRGDDCSLNSFALQETVFSPATVKQFAPAGGRPTNGEWPYYLSFV